MTDNKPLQKVEVVEDVKSPARKEPSVRDRLLDELSETRYSISKLQYGEFIVQAVDKALSY